MASRNLIAALVIAGAVSAVGPAWAQQEAQQQQQQQQQQDKSSSASPSGAGAAADASAQQGPGGSGALTVLATGEATVTAVDKEKRTVTLKNEQGKEQTIHVGKQARNFDQIKVGDQIKATLIDRVAVSVGKGGQPAAMEGALVARSPEGAKPGVIVAETDVIRDKIASVDQQARTITLEGMSGKPQTIKVGKDVDLGGLKKGDDVSVRCTQGLALIDQGAAGAAGEAQPAGAAIRPGEGVGDIDVTTKTATVESVDKSARTVTVKGEGGQTKTFHLGPEVRNFDQIQPGDKVQATLAEETAVAVTKGNAPPGAAEGMVMARAPEGARPGMFLAQQMMVTGKIDSVDADKHMLTMTEPDGTKRELKVSPKVDLSQLKAGDDVSAQVTSALGIIVEKPSSSSSSGT